MTAGEILCPTCGGATAPDHEMPSTDSAASAASVRGRRGVQLTHCSRCGAKIWLRDAAFSAEGHASDVERLMARLVEDHRLAKERVRGPWVSGSFYAFAALAFVLVVALVLVAVLATGLPVWVLPVVIVGALLFVSLVGSLQLRHDDRISEKSFLRLMLLTLRRVSLIGGGTKRE